LTSPCRDGRLWRLGKNAGGIALHDILKLFLSWGYWLWLAVLLAGQSLLLLLPSTSPNAACRPDVR